jgi:hypothetical protein
MRWSALIALALLGCGQSVVALDDAGLDRGSMVDRESPADMQIAPFVDATVDQHVDSAASSDVTADGDDASVADTGIPPPRTAPFDCSQNESEREVQRRCGVALQPLIIYSSTVCCVNSCYVATTCGEDASAPRCGASGRACGVGEACCWHRSVGRFRCVSNPSLANCEPPL